MTKAWALTKLSEVLQPISRRERVDPIKEYRLLGIRLDGVGPFHRETIQGSQSAATSLYKVKTGDFIYSRLFACRGAFGVIGSDLDGCYVSGEFPTFVTIDDRVDVNFLKLWFRLPMTIRKVDSNCTGSTPLTRNRFKENFFLNLDIPLPPVTEQRRIVAKIDALASEIEGVYGLQVKSTQELYFLYDIAVQSICYAGKYPLSNFGEVLSEAKNGIYKPPEFWGRGIPCIRMYNIDGPSMNTINLQLLDVTEDEFSTYSCQSGDLVFNRVNSAELVGKTGIITEKYPKCTFESKNMRLRVNQERVMPEFVAIILNSRKTKEYYRRVLKQQCGMATLNQGHVRNIPFPIPSLVEQEHIVAHIDSLKTKVEELDNLKIQALAELDALMPSILDKAFKGEL